MMDENDINDLPPAVVAETVSLGIASVQFRRAGKLYDFSFKNLTLNVGDHVIVDSEKGPSLAQIKLLKPVPTKGERKLKGILRRVNTKELTKPARWTDEEILATTRTKVDDLKLDMRLLKAENQPGSNKIVVYFSSPGRVDFRLLVKDLASLLKARIELKQVGARDETKLLGGIGICGREYCCSSFLREFIPVSIRMAKNQNLALNPSKVSGGCGRLLCCLTYENDVYTELRQTLPPRGAKVRVLDNEKIVQVLRTDLLNQLVEVDLDGQLTMLKLSAVEVLTEDGRRLRSNDENPQSPDRGLKSEGKPADGWDDDAWEQKPADGPPPRRNPRSRGGGGNHNKRPRG